MNNELVRETEKKKFIHRIIAIANANFPYAMHASLHFYRQEFPCRRCTRMAKETSAKVEKQRNAYNWNLTGNERASVTERLAKRIGRKNERHYVMVFLSELYALSAYIV